MARFNIIANFKHFLFAKEQHEEVIIDANKLCTEILDVADLEEMTREELEERFVSAYIRVLLYQAGYRSVIRGKGFFVNEKTIRPELVVKLFNNEKMTLKKAEQIIANMKKHIAQNDIAGQLEFDFENECFRESMTEEDLLKMLEAEAV
ncbi:MAG: hypothetical protein IIZ68_07540 [Clostridia bacterium]|nr:hypothetical protein [Clostridia bacterium]